MEVLRLVVKPPTLKLGIQSGTDRTVYCTWTFENGDPDYLDHYSVKWQYNTGDGTWWDGTTADVKSKQSLYSAPSNANRVRVKVKAIPKKYKVNGKEMDRWTTKWSSWGVYNLKSTVDKIPTNPSAPSVSIDKFKLTATYDTSDSNSKVIEFQVVKNNSTVVHTARSEVVTGHSSMVCNVEAGNEYKVRVRAWYGTDISGLINNSSGITAFSSEWSDYSSNVGTIPSEVSSITECYALTESSVQLSWTAVENATSYTIEYTSESSYFDVTTETQTMDITGNKAIVTGLDSGDEWFFRVRAVNDVGESGWSSIVSTVIGKKPAAPTTWSTTTSAISGETVVFYWVHNSEDGSSQTFAQLELTVNGTSQTITIQNSTDEETKDKTSSYSLNTSAYSQGAVILWRVRTRGITNEYGDWSIQRTLTLYAPPTLTMNVENVTDTLHAFPIVINLSAGPNSQTAISYYISITANEGYEGTDQVGDTYTVKVNDSVYSQTFVAGDNTHTVTLYPSDLDLEPGINYTLTCKVSMNSGLTAESSIKFIVDWEDEMYLPNANISINDTNLSAIILPYCVDENSVLVPDVTISVYRRQFDGKYVEIMTDMANTGITYITDLHPALDYARYRIVATSTTTGAVSYYDVPGYPINANEVVIQWDEEWKSFEITDDIEDELAEPTYQGSMIKLPYNIDVSFSNSPDVSHVEYIGREHPVSYYGTQLGETPSISVAIDKEDTEMIYALRRLSVYMGDVYIREPSGSGFWANVKVSFNKNHGDLTIPVTINVTRVEGGA